MTRAFTGAACAALLLAGTAAQAQMVYSTAVSGAINSVDSDLGDGTGYELQTETDLAYGNFTADIDLGYSMVDPDDGSDLSSLTIDLLPKYWITDTWGVGAYYSRDELDLDLGDTIDLDSYGLEGSYRTSGFEASLFVGETDVDGVSGVDTTDYGLRLRGEVGSQLTLFGNMVQSDVDTPAGDTDARSYGIGAGYAFNEQFSGFVAFQGTDVDDTDLQVRSQSIGVNYQTSVQGRPLILTGEYAHADADDGFGTGDGSRVSLGATVLFGNASSKRLPGTTVSSNALKGDRNAISGALGSVGY
ncbi:hypothetical protein GCM10011415_35960 [Salipiger pallidus]|uniref:Porin domain-containing protein n=1 Tax=Salipiger pallidus TaxID=1775170 RepID=A0A8J2ZME5_9RHOB|nr:porin [Salipiger pallidus]GGG82983.1 hypothetical protein GCM10011415_35960 [Salipiger pallidus]